MIFYVLLHCTNSLCSFVTALSSKLLVFALIRWRLPWYLIVTLYCQYLLLNDVWFVSESKKITYLLTYLLICCVLLLPILSILTRKLRIGLLFVGDNDDPLHLDRSLSVWVSVLPGNHCSSLTKWPTRYGHHCANLSLLKRCRRSSGSSGDRRQWNICWHNSLALYCFNISLRRVYVDFA